MYVPKMRERAEIDGRHGVFVVVGVDEKNQRAEVVSLASAAFCEENVSFAVMRPVPGSALPEAPWIPGCLTPTPGRFPDGAACEPHQDERRSQ